MHTLSKLAATLVAGAPLTLPVIAAEKASRSSQGRHGCHGQRRRHLAVAVRCVLRRTEGAGHAGLG